MSSEPPEPPDVEAYAAELGSGPDGAVEWLGDSLTDADAVARLAAGGDVVCRSENRRANRNKARALSDAAFGDSLEEAAHREAGPMALPHFPPKTRTPHVHAFYETSGTHSRRRR